MDIEWVIYHLIHNDDDFESVSLDIDYYNEDVWYRLITSLSRNTILTKIQINRAEIARSRTRVLPDLMDLFEAIRKIPTLRELHLLGGFTGADFNHLTITIPDWLFQNHPTLENIQMIVSDGTLNSRVLESLASALRLQQVKLELSESTELSFLCTSPTLQVLRVDAYGEEIDDDYIIAMADVLKTNEALKVLDMDYEISTKAFSSIADMLRENKCLKELRIAVKIDGENNNNNNNNNYDDGDNDDDDYDEEQPFISLMDALKENNTLSEFYNYRFRSCNGLSSTVTELQVELLEHNTTLHSFLLFQDEDNHPATIEKQMYLALNKSGRGRLFQDMENATKRDWVNVMANPLTVNNVDCLFYYLTTNPSLCKIDNINDDDNNDDDDGDDDDDDEDGDEITSTTEEETCEKQQEESTTTTATEEEVLEQEEEITTITEGGCEEEEILINDGNGEKVHSTNCSSNNTEIYNKQEPQKQDHRHHHHEEDNDIDDEENDDDDDDNEEDNDDDDTSFSEQSHGHIFKKMRVN